MSVYRALDAIKDSAEFFVFLQPFLDSAAGVQHGRMILTAESHADHRIGSAGKFATQEHRDLTREGDKIRTSLGSQIGDANAEIFADGFLHGLDGYFFI